VIPQDDTQHAVDSADARRSPPEPLPARMQPPAQALARALGNRGFTRTIARMRQGAGILPDGVVHPDVEGAIAAARGAGRTLDPATAAGMGSAFGNSFDDVRIHDDDGAAALARSVAARAFTVGTDIFFGAGEYRPVTVAGGRLLAHELTHVIQQRGAAKRGPLTVSEPGDALEREADAAARTI
jgi:hypothetical protein